VNPQLAARACLVGGVMVAASLAGWLVPRITWLGNQTGPWRIWLLGGAALFALAGLRWARPRLEPLTGDNEARRRQAAHDFPFRVARLFFAASVVAGLGTAVHLALSGQAAGQALVAGVITYLVLVLPVLGTYLVARRLLRSHAAGVRGGGALDAVRQPVALRLAFAVQLPVVVSAAGIVLVEQADGQAYARALEDYHRENWARSFDRAIRVVAQDQRHAFARAAAPPEGVELIVEPGRPVLWATVPADESVGRPLGLRLPPLVLLALVTLLAALLGRWLAGEVTAELVAIREGLRALRADEDDAEPLPTAPRGAVSFRENAAVTQAFQGTLASFARRRAAIQAAARQRQEAEQAKARFLAHLSHELKSPLNSILGFTELLLAGIEGPLEDREREQLAIIWRSGDALLRFILALLDLARMEGPDTGLRARAATSGELAAAVQQHIREDPVGSVAMTVRLPNGLDVGCLADVMPTARALVLGAGVLLDAMEGGQVEIALARASVGGGLDAHIRVAAVEADETERVRLIDQVSTARRVSVPANDDRFSSATAALILLRRIAEAQAGRFSTANEGWPRFTLTLPPG
jgi:signal transduction histidine kinase